MFKVVSRKFPNQLKNGLGIIVVCLLYYPSLFGGFNTDEHLSVYLARLPLSEIVNTTLHAHNTPPPFYIILHFWLKLVPAVPEYTRILNLIFVVLSALCILRIVTRIGWPHLASACLLFIFFNLFFIRDLFVNLRPYPVCVWFALLSLEGLISYCRSRRGWDLIFYLLSMICGYQMHIVFAMIIPLHLVLSLYLLETSDSGRVRTKSLCAVVVVNAIAFMSIFLWKSQLIRIVTEADDLDSSIFTSLADLLLPLVVYPSLMCLTGILIVLLSDIAEGRKNYQLRLDNLGQGIFSAFCVTTILIGLSIIFVAHRPPSYRYYFHYHLWVAIIFIYLFLHTRMIGRLILTIVFVSLQYWQIQNIDFFRGDWDRIAKQIEIVSSNYKEPDPKVFLFSQLIELRSDRWLEDPIRNSLLSSPLTNYSELRNVSLIPWGPFNDKKRTLVEEHCTQILSGERVYIAGTIEGRIGDFDFGRNIADFNQICGLVVEYRFPWPTQISLLSAVKK